MRTPPFLPLIIFYFGILFVGSIERASANPEEVRQNPGLSGLSSYSFTKPRKIFQSLANGDPNMKLLVERATQIISGKTTCAEPDFVKCKMKTNVFFLKKIANGLEKIKAQVGSDIYNEQIRLNPDGNPTKFSWWLEDLTTQQIKLNSLMSTIEALTDVLDNPENATLVENMPEFKNLNQAMAYVDDNGPLLDLVIAGQKGQLNGLLMGDPGEDRRVQQMRSKMGPKFNLTGTSSTHIDTLGEDKFYTALYWNQYNSTKESNFSKLESFLRDSKSQPLPQTNTPQPEGKHSSALNLGTPTPSQSTSCILDYPVMAMIAYYQSDKVKSDSALVSIFKQNLIDHCSSDLKDLTPVQSSLAEFLNSKYNFTDKLPAKPPSCTKLGTELFDLDREIRERAATKSHLEFPMCQTFRKDPTLNTSHFGGSHLKFGLQQPTDWERDYFIPPTFHCRSMVGLMGLSERAQTLHRLKLEEDRALNENGRAQADFKKGASLESLGLKLKPTKKKTEIPMAHRFATTPPYQGEGTHACVSYALSSMMSENRSKDKSTKAAEIDAMALDREFRKQGFAAPSGGIDINAQGTGSHTTAQLNLNQVLGQFQIPTTDGNNMIPTAKMVPAFPNQENFKSTEIEKLAKDGGFVAVIDTDSHIETGNQMQFTLNTGSEGHVFHVIDHAKSMMNLQTGREEPMYQVRDSLSIHRMTYWVSESELLTHLKGVLLPQDRVLEGQH